MNSIGREKKLENLLNFYESQLPGLLYDIRSRRKKLGWERFLDFYPVMRK